MNRFKDFVKKLITYIVKPIVWLKITPNQITFLGLIFTCLSAYFVIIESFYWSAFYYFLSGLCDAMDGAVARAGNTQSEFGNFFDSTIDRIADAVIIFAVVFMPMHNEYYFVVRNQIFVVGSLTILTASLISYTRAKAESLGVKGEFGILPRPERWFLILVMILSQKWVLILSVLAILGLITVAQRIWSIGKLLR